MYYENYGDYMRSQTGYQNMPNQYYVPPTYQNQYNYMNMSGRQNQNVNNLYPELYSEINKKIEEAIQGQDYRLTDENVNNITEKVFNDYKDGVAETSKQTSNASKQNNLIQDFIRILVIKYLISKQKRTSPYQAMPPMANSNYYYNGLY